MLFLVPAGLLFSKLSINHHETIQLTNKMINMKKFLVVLSIVAFAACNNSASTDAKADSTKMAVDSTKMTSDSSKMAMDSSSKKMDTAAKKMDSAAKK
jgi:hypothetical protein